MADSGKVVPLCTEKEFGRLMEAAIESLAEWSELEVPSYVVRTKVIAAALIELDKSGRLLPSGGEVSTERVWPTFWRHETGTRAVITWPDGSRYTGPFVPDPPLTPEEIEAMRAAAWERVRRVLPNGGRPVVSDNSEVPNAD